MTSEIIKRIKELKYWKGTQADADPSTKILEGMSEMVTFVEQEIDAKIRFFECYSEKGCQCMDMEENNGGLGFTKICEYCWIKDIFNSLKQKLSEMKEALQ